MRDSASRGYGPHGAAAALVAAMVVVSSIVYADPARGVFPVVLRDQSCENVASSQVNQATDCNPDIATTATSDSAATQQNVATAQNINSPNSSQFATSTSP